MAYLLLEVPAQRGRKVSLQQALTQLEIAQRVQVQALKPSQVRGLRQLRAPGLRQLPAWAPAQ